MHDKAVQQESAGELVEIKMLSENQEIEIVELCRNAGKGMEPIQSSGELVKFAADIFPLEEKEAKMLLEYLDGHGYMLAVKDAELYRGDLCKEPNGICWEKYFIRDAIEAACEWNHEMLQESKELLQDSCGDYQILYERYKELKKDKVILSKVKNRN